MSGSQLKYFLIILGGEGDQGHDYLDYAEGEGGSRLGQKLIT